MSSGSPAPNCSPFASIRAIREQNLSPFSVLKECGRPAHRRPKVGMARRSRHKPQARSAVPDGAFVSKIGRTRRSALQGFATIRAIRGFFSSFTPSAIRHPSFLQSRSVLSVSSVVKPSASGSALILVLLITALLATIAVSFLSTSRIEQIAAKNFSRQNAASGLAELATQQAMGKIQQGFTINGTGTTTTTVITSQPGAIRQFVFQNGNITSNQTINLFSGGGNASTNGTANLNYLNNPTLNATLSGNSADNQWTITGNASQRIDLPLVEITSNGTVIGRVAYYVDDDGTKINLNAATGNRSTLNVADSRPLSLTVLDGIGTATENAIKTLFDGGASNSTSEIKNWTHIFRPEQVYSLGFSINRTTYPPAFFTSLPPRDFHMKYTPWGARRLFINDTTEVPLNSNGVNKTVDALSSQHLKNIYGQTFADKYTLTGLKQTAANILQMRSKDTMYMKQSYAFKGGLIGSENLNADGIPNEYLGYAPYAVINEVGMTGRLAVEQSGGLMKFRIVLQVCVECGIWEFFYSSLGASSNATLIATLENLTYDVSYSSNGSSTSTVSLGGPWGAGAGGGSFAQFYTNTNATYTQRVGFEDPNDWRNGDSQPTYWDPAIKPNRNRNQSANPSLSSIGDLVYGNKYHIGTVGRPSRGGEISAGFSFPTSSNITISQISNVKASIKKILLLANGTESSSIRDWFVGGKDIGDFNIPLVTYANGLRTTTNSTVTSGNTTTITTITTFPTMNLPLTYSNGNFTYNATTTTIKDIVTISNNTTSTISTNNTSENVPVTSNSISIWADPEPLKAPAQSYARIDPHIKSITGAGNYKSNPWPALATNCTWAWASFGNSTWGTATNNGTQVGNAPAGYGFTGAWDNFYNSSAFWTKNNTIQGDPLPKYASSWQYLHFYQHRNSPGPGLEGDDGGIFNWPYWVGVTNFLDSAGNNVIIFPADLGKVPTNYPWRKLRMQVQPRNEVSSANGGGNLTTQTLIPDWAILDVISFGTNSSSTLPLNYAAPANANNKFFTVNGIITSNRTNALLALTKPFDNATVDSCEFLQNPYDLSKKAKAGKIKYSTGSDLLASARASGNITANLTWSQLVAANVGNITWSPVSYWGSTNNTTTTIRKKRGYPSGQIVLPSEIVEIRDIADLVTTNSTTHETSTRFDSNDIRFFKLNDIRLSPFFPGATTCSNFFAIYAYAQAGQLQNKNQPESSSNPFTVDSEALTKTLVEVEITTPATETTPAVYKVKKLYTQPIPMGQ